ncbi:COP9 signalosome complex subunit 5 [Rhizophlyctis rosea]|uniref:COP9 signalosome complex subunit 5 n=1 Tax=Rhizophlyctis rosea TaxID=64517 RepID=A0AAD5SJ05_9FUNG|nr:COP9 signalosome complex subunit 5 [Rhizophlyctis rosea]
MDTKNAQKRFEMENQIKTDDNLYFYDDKEQKEINNVKPWKENPNHFKKVRMSAVALIKMVMHARSGGNIEVMGLMQGKVIGDTMIVMDSFALPVEGTETRVNAAQEGYEYMVQYMEKAKEVGRLENAIGWYHSHPGYGCWLSGIDVATQMLNQKYQEPWLAVVIDPTRTVSAGKVEIGAFRTYPEGYKPAETAPSEYQTIPLSKIEDFGVHANSYYQLDISFFKSVLDNELLEKLWHKYWVNTLSSSSLVTNREYIARQISDLGEKIEQADVALNASSMRGSGGLFFGAQQEAKKKDGDGPLAKVARDSSKITVEAAHGLMAQVLKNALFNKSMG